MKALFLVWGFFQSLDFACSQTCVSAKDYVCDYIPNSYPLHLSSLVFFVRNMGEINSTVFNYTSLSSVTSLTMRQSGIRSIAPQAFAQFQSLESLNLHSNELSHITSDWFVHQEVLKSLILINNSIAALDENSFAGLVNLADLELSQNHIHTITSGSFGFLPGLKRLDLSHNKLRHLNVDILIPMNQTEIVLNGNPWDCSCTVHEFALYLRELKKASLLLNEMQVLCMSPAHQRGSPVWNVSKCLNPTTDVAITNENSQNITAGGTNLSTIISLVVLYHRKQEQKHLVTIKPFQEEQEHASPGPGQARPDCRAVPEFPHKLESISCDRKMNQSHGRFLLKLDQTVLESQVYQIYSGGIFQAREKSGRAKSAGPVLSRTDGSGGYPADEMECPRVWMVKDEVKHAGWTEKDLEKFDDQKTEAEEKEDVRGSKGEEEPAGKTQLEKKHRPQRQDDEFITALEKGVGYQQSLELGVKGEYHPDGNVEGQGFLYSEDSVPSEEECGSAGDGYDLSVSCARSQAPQTHEDDIQPLGDVENMPYLTIGADPKKQSPNPEQICVKASSEQVNLRPIRRTLSWPPTAAQWKKHLAQTQHVLSVSPKLIFVTQYDYHIGTLPSGMSSAFPENIPHSGCSGFTELQIQDLTPIQPSMETGKLTNPSCNLDLSSLTGDYAEINEGRSEMIQPHPPVNAEAPSDLVTINPPCESMSSKAAKEVKMRSSKKKKANRTPQGEQTRAISGKKPKSGERDERKGVRHRQRNESRSGSGAHPSGGSPSDDSLLVDNEYTFIDLLHEVVENHGRWTRDSWRQSHMNKKQIKNVNKS